MIRKIISLICFLLFSLLPETVFSYQILESYNCNKLSGFLEYSQNGESYSCKAQWARVIADEKNDDQISVVIGFEETDLAIEIILHLSNDAQWEYRNFQISAYDKSRLCKKAVVSPLSPRAEYSIKYTEEGFFELLFRVQERHIDLSQTKSFASWKALPVRGEIIHGITLTALAFEKKKTGIADTFSQYTINDLRMMSVPMPGSPLSFSSPESLALYLTQDIEDPGIKLRVIHDWICREIYYDSHPGRSGDISLYLPYKVLKSRRAVCGGYATLFKYMAEAAGLSVITVSGTAFNNDQWINHAWNAVSINGEIYMIDVTWDCRNSVNQFGYKKKEFSNKYFLISPQNFQYNHTPHISKYSFTSSKDIQSRSSISLYQSFYKLNGNVHPIILKNRGEKRYLEQFISFNPSFRKEKFIAEIVSQGISQDEIVPQQDNIYLEKSSSGLNILVSGLDSGTWLLRIGIQRDGESIPLAEIPVPVSHGENIEKLPFPRQNPSFQELGLSLLEPYDGILSKTSERLISFYYEDIEKAEVWSVREGQYLFGQDMKLLDNKASLCYYVPENADEIRILVYDSQDKAYIPLVFKVVE